MTAASFANDSAKWLVKSIVAAKVDDLAKTVITDHTRFEKDSLAVKLGSGAIVVLVALKIDPVVDKMVDKTANFIADKREARKAKKNEKK